MNKAYVETTILTDILLKPDSEKQVEALRALERYAKTLLPVYAIKECKAGPMTGWRLGYVIASSTVINEARKVHDFLTVGAASPLQEAAVTALELPDSYYHELQQLYAEKRKMFLHYLGAADLRYSEPQGAYYVMP